jgi:glucose-6-phosphate 1-dehydrogenase
VIHGDKSLFIRKDELGAAWDIFTPLLHSLEEQRVKPQPYPFGGKGPDDAVRLAAKYGIKLHL